MEIPTLTRARLADNLYIKVRISYIESTEIIDKIFSEIINAVKDENIMKIHNFGSFNLRKKESRIGRNPKTGEEYIVKARNVVSFYPAASLKAKINN